ncbi:molybdopterin molybdotransferase MoeA [Phorcysia thermohydrogeniphila]|uniref:Molybdopterin molybdenumtransferase n=1 Tax=Phorcysia thermohydrogeniphila TaxID=936138 RepID=A0A4V2PDR3_9BACT|nr:gephyrin-like molybdotransferase Glp [Phorcysia thermohydrogeniphila]TCK06236.1 molybdopterin molybdochelatase [Phorcysia thermohydrogeniphila]
MKVKREEAKRIILEACKEKSFEVVTLDGAYGRVLAEDVYSPVDVPGEDKSAIDGYAFNADSVKELPARLKIVGETAAGDTEKKRVNLGEAVFVMTGGVIPEGANAAVRIEDVSVEGDYVVVDFPVEPGTLVNFKGSEIKKGEKVLERGELLDYRKVGLLANIGIYRLKVYQKPKVAVIATGNEVLEPYEPYRPGTVRNSNYYILKGLLEKEGAEVVYMGVVGDSLEEMKELFEEAVSSGDLVVTTGGVSKGRYDFVRDVVESLGFDVKFSMTNIRPGRPLVFAVRGEKLFFGLPGYPAAMFVNALEFLVPAVRKLSGRKEVENHYLVAVAAEPLKSRKGRVDFIRVNFLVEEGTLKVKSAGSQQTSNLRTMAMCDGLAIVGEERGTVQVGEVVEVFKI